MNRYMSILLCLIISSTSAALFDDLKDAYNQDRFSDIYNQLVDSVKSQITEEVFSQQLQQIKTNDGNIIFQTDFSTDQLNYYAIGLETNLAAGFLAYKTDGNNQLESFQLSNLGSPSIIQFLIANPKKVAFTIIEKTTTLLDYNGNTYLPLASVLKIPVCAEFSRQLSIARINPNWRVSLDSLNRFYLRHFDFGHQTFLDKYADKIINNSLSYQDIAEGMILYSSNTNTEYLQSALGMTNIDATQADMGFKSTKSIYLVSSMLALLNIYDETHDKYIERLKNMNQNSFNTLHLDMHDHLLRNTEYAKEILENGYKDLLDAEVLEIYVNFLTQSSTNEIGQLLQKLNQQSLPQYNAQFYATFFQLMGKPTMDVPAAKKQFAHAGFKGGSANYDKDTNCVLNMAYFDELLPELGGNQRSMVLFMNQLDNETEYSRLIVQIGYFKDLLSYNTQYHKAVSDRINDQSNKIQ